MVPHFMPWRTLQVGRSAYRPATRSADPRRHVSGHRNALKPLLRTAYRSLGWMGTNRTLAFANGSCAYSRPPQFGGDRRQTGHTVGALNSALITPSGPPACFRQSGRYTAAMSSLRWQNPREPAALAAQPGSVPGEQSSSLVRCDLCSKARSRASESRSSPRLFLTHRTMLVFQLAATRTSLAKRQRSQRRQANVLSTCK
jgi:hypothetical protein